MRAILIFLLASSSIGTLFAQDSLVDELNANSLQGKVKSVKELSFACSVKEGKEIKGKPKRYFSDQDDFYIVFDTLGNRTEKSQYKSTGALKSRYLYTYDRWGFISSVTSMNINGTVKEKVQVYNKLKDSTYLIERKLSYEKEKKNVLFKYEYSADSICTEKLYVPSQQWGILTRKFNSDGELILFNKFEYGQLKVRYEYVYNDMGQMVEEKRFNKTNDLEVTYSWDYDSGGRRTTMKVTKKKVVVESWTYRYTFDEVGNWITCTEFESGKARFLKERQITYY